MDTTPASSSSAYSRTNASSADLAELFLALMQDREPPSGWSKFCNSSNGSNGSNRSSGSESNGKKKCDCQICGFFSKVEKKDLKATKDTFMEGYMESKIDFLSYPDRYELYMELPGVKRADIEIKVCEGTLTVKAKCTLPPTKAACVMTISERRSDSDRLDWCPKYARRIPLPLPVKTAEASTTYEDGLLFVCLPKAQPEAPKEIRIPLN